MNILKQQIGGIKNNDDFTKEDLDSIANAFEKLTQTQGDAFPELIEFWGKEYKTLENLYFNGTSEQIKEYHKGFSGFIKWMNNILDKKKLELRSIKQYIKKEQDKESPKLNWQDIQNKIRDVVTIEDIRELSAEKERRVNKQSNKQINKQSSEEQKQEILTSPSLKKPSRKEQIDYNVERKLPQNINTSPFSISSKPVKERQITDYYYPLNQTKKDIDDIIIKNDSLKKDIKQEYDNRSNNLKQQVQSKQPITKLKENYTDPPIKITKKYGETVEFKPKTQKQMQDLINWFDEQTQYPKEFYELDIDIGKDKYMIVKKPVGKLLKDQPMTRSVVFEEQKI